MELKYGYILDITKTPSDNAWTTGREITTASGVVYGYEGYTTEGEGLTVFNQEDFATWRTENEITLPNE